MTSSRTSLSRILRVLQSRNFGLYEDGSLGDFDVLEITDYLALFLFVEDGVLLIR